VGRHGRRQRPLWRERAGSEGGRGSAGTVGRTAASYSHIRRQAERAALAWRLAWSVDLAGARSPLPSPPLSMRTVYLSALHGHRDDLRMPGECDRPVAWGGCRARPPFSSDTVRAILYSDWWGAGLVRRLRCGVRLQRESPIWVVYVPLTKDWRVASLGVVECGAGLRAV